MDIQRLDVNDGDIIILTYGGEIDVDSINTHYNQTRKAIQEKYNCVVIANHTDFIQDVTVLTGEVLPFR